MAVCCCIVFCVVPLQGLPDGQGRGSNRNGFAVDLDAEIPRRAVSDRHGGAERGFGVRLHVALGDAAHRGERVLVQRTRLAELRGEINARKA